MLEGALICGSLCGLTTLILVGVFGGSWLRNRQLQQRCNASADILADALDIQILGQDRKGRAWYGGERDGRRFAFAFAVTRTTGGGGSYSTPLLWLMCETTASAPIGWKASSNRTITAYTSFEDGFYCRAPERIAPPVRAALRNFALEVGPVQINDLERLVDWRPPVDFLRSAAVAVHHERGDDQTPGEVRTRMAALAVVAGTL